MSPFSERVLCCYSKLYLQTYEICLCWSSWRQMTLWSRLPTPSTDWTSPYPSTLWTPSATSQTSTCCSLPDSSRQWTRFWAWHRTSSATSLISPPIVCLRQTTFQLTFATQQNQLPLSFPACCCSRLFSRMTHKIYVTCLFTWSPLGYPWVMCTVFHEHLGFSTLLAFQLMFPTLTSAQSFRTTC